MDFIFGIIFIIIIIFMIINFASITISNKSSDQLYDSNQNFLFAYNYNTIPNNTIPNNNIPKPRNANSPLALNKKINLEEQTYDYRKYFFV